MFSYIGQAHRVYSKNLFSLCTIKCAVVPIRPLKYTPNGCQLWLEKGHLIFSGQVTLWNCRLGLQDIQCLNLHSKSKCFIFTWICYIYVVTILLILYSYVQISCHVKTYNLTTDTIYHGALLS